MNLLIVTGIFPPDIGGPSTYVPLFCSSRAERKHQITVVTLSDSEHQDDGAYPFRVVRIPRNSFKPSRWVRTFITLFRLGWNVDVLYVNGLALEAVLANVILRKPLVQKIVGDLAWERSTNRGWLKDNFEVFQKQRYGIKTEALKALRSWWIRRAHKVIVPSSYLAKWVGNWDVSRDKISLIYNALERHNGIKPVRLPLRTPIKVVTVGRLIPLKRMDRVITAVAEIYDVGLVVVGGGPEQQNLEKLANTLGIADRVYLAGHKSKSETLALMAGCDIFVLNSIHEAFPHVVLEAMSLGLPVIVTDVGGTSEIVNHRRNGILIDPQDDKALHSALSDLISRSSEQNCLADGARQTIEQFDFCRMVEETEAVLEALV